MNRNRDLKVSAEKENKRKCRSIGQMQSKISYIFVALSVFTSSASYSMEKCNDVTGSRLPKEVVGSISLYPSSDYAWDIDGFSRIVSMRTGIPCIHRDSGKRETLQCSNGIIATKALTSRPCTSSERYSTSSSFSAKLTSAICADYGVFIETNWKLRDKNGQIFGDAEKNWETAKSDGCILTSSGNYEQRGYKVLTLRAGDSYLYFIRETRNTYTPKRQPAL